AANDFSSKLIGKDKKYGIQKWEINLTRSISYRTGKNTYEENKKSIQNILNDFETRDVRIIIGNFNQTVAEHVFCHTSAALSEYITQYKNKISSTGFFHAYAYDGLWSIALAFQHLLNTNDDNHYNFTSNVYEHGWTSKFKAAVQKLDFYGVTGRVQYSDGERVGEIVVEQYIACRITGNICEIPCHNGEECSLKLVKIFLAKENGLINLYPVMWHGKHKVTLQQVIFIS
ncbi:unnamed protein product, partial [Didymodactylos carnosus]